MMETVTFSRFPEATKIPESEQKYVQAGSTFVAFFDRLLFKWKVTVTVESHQENHQIYFTNHKNWISVEHENEGGQQLATVHSYLAIKLFTALKKNLDFQIEYSLLQIESAANLLADYVVKIMKMTECLEQNHGSLRCISTIQAELWKLSEDRFKFEMMRQLVNTRKYTGPPKTSLKELFYDLSKVPSLHHRTTKTFCFFGVDRVENSLFCWPPTFNFRDCAILFNEKHLLQYQKDFIQKLAKKLGSRMQIGGEYRKTSGKQSYQFILTLSMAGWEWIVSESTVAISDQNSPKKSVTFKGAEGRLLDQIYSSLLSHLSVPAALCEKLTNGNVKCVNSVVNSVSQLLVEMRYYRTERNPSQEPRWRRLASNFWLKTGKFDPQAMKKVLKSSSAPVLSQKKENVVNKQTRKRAAIESQSTPETTEPARQYVRNGRMVTKRRRSTFSSPARGYVPPRNSTNREAHENIRAVFRKRFTQNKPFFNQLIGYFQQHRRTSSISVTVDKLRETKTMRAFFNHLLCETRVNLQISSPRNEQYGILLFDLVSVKSDDYSDTALSLLRLEWLIGKEIVQPPLTVIEEAIDQIVKTIIEKAGQNPELFEKINEALVTKAFDFLAFDLIKYLKSIPPIKSG